MSLANTAAVPRAQLDLRELLERFSDARRRSDALFDLVRPEALYERPIPERHRIIFYVGHLEAFDWNLLKESLAGPHVTHRELDRLFAFGIDPVGGGLPTDQPSDWPPRRPSAIMSPRFAPRSIAASTMRCSILNLYRLTVFRCALCSTLP